MIMGEFLKIGVTVLMAIPFVYMFIDVTFELVRKSLTVMNRKTIPILSQFVSSFFN